MLQCVQKSIDCFMVCSTKIYSVKIAYFVKNVNIAFMA